MKRLLCIILILGTFHGAFSKSSEKNCKKTRIIIDTDANNELDDQHALAYAFLNTACFDIEGITVNNTLNGSGIQGQYDEAKRIICLFNLQKKLPLKKGADKSYAEIKGNLHKADFDGKEAVDFIIEIALKKSSEKLVLIPVGKLTNIALAIKKEPRIVNNIRVVWLGSNYPFPGEYNLENDTSSINPVINSGVDFEMVTVRYGLSDGTAAVTVSLDEIKSNLQGKGPRAKEAITGRHGGTFQCFGDYSVNLFEHCEMHGTPAVRALFDMAAVAVVKNKDWARKTEVPAPRLDGVNWIGQPENKHKIIIWDHFNRDKIVNDLFSLIR